MTARRIGMIHTAVLSHPHHLFCFALFFIRLLFCLSAEQMHFRTRCNSPVLHRNEAVSHFRPVNRFQFQPSIFHTASCQCHHSIFADFFWNLCFCISNARGRFRYFIRFFSRLIHRVGTDGKIPRGLLQRYRQHSMQPVKIHDF